MPEPYFIYKGISSKDMGILVNVPPPIIRIPRDITKIVIPGRNGFLTEDSGTYGGTLKPCQCTLLDIANVDEVLMWLEGSGDVIFSNQPDRVYKGSIISQIPFDKIMFQWYKFIVIFECQPIAQTLTNDVIQMDKPGTIFSEGTSSISKPIIKVYGTGSIDLIINGNINHLTNVVGSITIDSQMIDAYRDTLLQNSNMTGEFPELIIGANTINWTGTVTYIEITPNWGYI